MTSKLMAPTLPGFLLTALGGLLSADQQLVIQAINDGTYFHYQETPTGAIDDSNTIFTLAGNPNPDASLEVYLNGQLMTLTEDYTFSTVTITFNNAPMSGSILRVTYVISPV